MEREGRLGKHCRGIEEKGNRMGKGKEKKRKTYYDFFKSHHDFIVIRHTPEISIDSKTLLTPASFSVE